MPKILEESEIAIRLERLPGWEKKVSEINKKYVFRDFATALKFAGKVGELAEEIDHHPDIFIHGYKFVTLTLTTHSAGGLTVLDFELAGRIDRIVLS